MTAATELVSQLPPDAVALGPDGIPIRDRMILDMLAAEQSPPYEWAQIVSASPRGMLRLLVGADAVKLGDESDAIRVNLCQLAAQELADRHDCTLLTPKLNDLTWEQSAIKLSPSTIKPYPASHTAAMVQHSRTIDGKLPPNMPPNMIVGNVGKGAVNSTLLWNPPKPAKMAIYGWHVPTGWDPAATPDGGRVIQPESTRHVAYFVDYSATVRYVRREVELTTDAGTQFLDIADVGLDPELCSFVSHAGPIIMRHPGIGCPPVVAGGGAPSACPIPGGGAPPPPAQPSGVSTAALVVGGVVLATAAAYYATRS